tara:strand:- start:3548 stop:4033 length:486 start_codon:yes stop_codon:yes gene_type:complete
MVGKVSNITTGAQAYAGMTYLRRGIGHVGSYQSSGIPYLTSSLECARGEHTTVTFPTITKTITVVNTATGSDNRPIRIHFSQAGAYRNYTEDGVGRQNYIVLNNEGSGALNGSVTFDARVGEIYLSSDITPAGTASVYAALTPIPKDDVSGSYWSGSSGIG